jgi:transcriptional regulator with XRE-family HTH domain
MLDKELGRKIRSMRKARAITLDVLTMRTGLSTGYLSKIERGLSSPPIATLTRIASSLGVKVSDFFAAYDENHRISIVTPGERKRLTREGQSFGYHYETLAHKRQNKLMEPFLIRLTPDPNDKRMFVHGGEELLFLLAGEINMIYGRENFVVKEAGTCIYIDAAVPHRADCLGTDEALVLVVISQVPSEFHANSSVAAYPESSTGKGGAGK